MARSAHAIGLWAGLVAAACAPGEPCHSDADCAPGQSCDAQGTCVQRALLDDGARCSSDLECRSGWCLTHAERQVCSRGCASTTDCATALACQPAIGRAGELTLGCLAPPGIAVDGAPCLDDGDCLSGLCHGWLCTRPCPTCAAMTRCEAATLSRPWGQAEVELCLPALAPEVLALEPAPTPASAPVELSFELPAGLASFVIVLVDDDGLRPAVTRLLAPDGSPLLDLDDDALDLNPGYHYPGAVAVLVPATDDTAAQPQAGTYRMQVGTFDPAVWDDLVPIDGALERIEVVLERAGLQGGLLDLNLHFATATGLHAAAAEDDTEVQALLGELDATYRSRAGVAFGDVRFSDLPPTAARVLDGDQVRALCATHASPGAHGLAVNVLVVQELAFTAGLSGGIPGPPGIYGTAASGVVVAYQGDGARTGVLLAHELGHFLGLRHTTETTGGRHDPIVDTPECASGTAATECPDYGNLMFPLFPLRSGLGLSDGQVQVLRGNPVLYQTVLPLACPTAAATTDLTPEGFGSGSTRGLDNRLAASCGGTEGADRVLVFRHPVDSEASLRVSLHGLDFAAVLSVRQAPCDDALAELGCATAVAGEVATLELGSAARAPLFVLVDGQGAEAGEFWVQVEVVPP